MNCENAPYPARPSRLDLDGGQNPLQNGWSVGMIAYLLDEDLTILWANDCFYACAGYEGEAFRRRFQNLRSYFGDYPEDFTFMKCGCQKLNRADAPDFSLNLRLPRREGGFRWYRLRAAAAGRDGEGRTVIHGVLVPEEGRPPEKKAPQSYQWMLDEYMGNAYVSDMETYELYYVNQTICETLGHPPEELLGQKCYRMIQGLDAPCPFCTNHLLSRERFYQWQFHNPMLGRSYLNRDRIVDWAGRKARLELSLDDYSLRFKLEKKDQELAAIIRSIPGGLARLDARDYNTVLWYGGGFLELIGYTAEQFRTELHSQCGYIYPEDLSLMVDSMKSAMRSAGDTMVEARIVTRSGEVRLLSITLSYVSGERSWDGVPSFYSVGIDLTRAREEQDRQRRALEDACEAARVASEAKTNFLSAMSHDIRTPMNAIMGMTAIAQSNLSCPEKVGDCLEKISASSRHLLGLINEVLDMSKIESGKIDLTLETVSLPQLMQEVMDICLPLIRQKRQKLSLRVGRVRHERVAADGDRLRQVLTNLMSNAVKYTPEGGNIGLKIDELGSPIPGKSQFEFIFTDNGIGMDPQFLPHVFEPFVRAQDSRVSRIQGTGLGMAITENIVRMMNGTIEVQSEMDKGSRFAVSVPLELIGPQEKEDRPFSGLRALAVNDTPGESRNTRALLEELGLRVSWALTGREAVRLAEEAQKRGKGYFAVLLDWDSPENGGLETVRALRELPKAPYILTAAADYPEEAEPLLQAGVNAPLRKPLFKSKLRQALEQFSPNKEAECLPDPARDPYPLAGKQVLLAEDNELNREIALELLAMQGVKADPAENGQAALERFSASAPGEYDAILMDIQMPVMDGYGAAAAIRALGRPDAKTIPILALTANAFAADVGKARSAGMNDHIPKPIDVGKLMETLEKWLS